MKWILLIYGATLAVSPMGVCLIKSSKKSLVYGQTGFDMSNESLFIVFLVCLSYIREIYSIHMLTPATFYLWPWSRSSAVCTPFWKLKKTFTVLLFTFQNIISWPTKVHLLLIFISIFYIGFLHLIRVHNHDETIMYSVRILHFLKCFLPTQNQLTNHLYWWYQLW